MRLRKLLKNSLKGEKMRFKLLAGVLLTTFSASAFCGQQWCTGKIVSSYLHKGGNLYIFGDWNNQNSQICNINNTWKGVEPVVCKGWLSIVLVAKLSQTDVVVNYADVPSCTEIPMYESSPSPTYIMTR